MERKANGKESSMARTRKQLGNNMFSLKANQSQSQKAYRGIERLGYTCLVLEKGRHYSENEEMRSEGEKRIREFENAVRGRLQDETFGFLLDDRWL